MLEISLLGPTEVRVSGVSVSLSPLERNLLAALALVKGTVVSTERIIDCLWDDRPPASPRSRVQGLVSSLRRKVGEALETRHPGYLLVVEEVRVDLDECEDLARRARQAATPDARAACLRQALRQWRGAPLDGVTAPGIEFDRVRLTELRLGLLEERFDADLELGRHAEVVAELTATVSAHPLRERLAGQLMLALYRSNRQADALKAYHSLRERLADELGSDPCADLRNLHATILRGEPRRTAEPAVEAGEPGPRHPAQLPGSVGHFTGRDSELAALTRAISRPVDEPRVLMVSGAGGIGKTALVVRWAHSVADRYPDGQIFVRLHGERVSTRDALGSALGGLGVPQPDVPSTVDERASLYRTLLSGRRVLVVLDDAGALDQLLAFVPPTTVSQLVATSRRRFLALAAHHAVQALRVEPMTPQATADLLTRIVGADRMRESAAERVVHWCGGWPLTTRLAGTKLAARPWQSLSSFADELDEHGDRLLDDDPRSVRAALVSAHKTLSPAAAYLFGRLGLNPSPSLSLDDAGGAGSSLRRVRRLLDELISAHLVVETGPDRFRLYDVVRRFARQCGAELLLTDSDVERVADSYRI
ncbi:DNA-binding SARP family transcriptional activator [Hamadaea flava]|uniref:BTAD domain-containing putative transcriptional regulator n=1 Tax=Hamadaea flava TaxID=1742688 RepID=A0ABV8LNW1_9ACTN|nr:BTAD domain-containing putative transcriptional regulator [Hamadaea flava]MCP2322707.1 DNA-binding SARP family transcriptional activator [Hamadaea flava]